MLEWSEEVTIILNSSYSMSRQTSTMTISLPEDLKQFAIKRSRTAHFGTPSDYIRGLIREDLQGVRIIPVTGFEHYLLFYTALRTPVKVLRILHAARDFPTIFSE